MNEISKEQLYNKITDDHVQFGEFQDFSYHGDLTVKTLRGKTVTSTKTYHNNGLPNLFRFICSALSGNYTSRLKPSKLRLFTLTNENEEDKLKNFTWNKAFTSLSQYVDIASASVYYDVSPVITRITKNADNPDQDYYSVTYHFRIPSAYISKNKIYFVGLYSNSALDDQDAMAYYTFNKEVQTNTQGESGTTITKELVWDPLVIPEDAQDFSIMLEWTMSVLNA